MGSTENEFNPLAQRLIGVPQGMIYRFLLPMQKGRCNGSWGRPVGTFFLDQGEVPSALLNGSRFPAIAVAISHVLTVASFPADARRLPSGENATLVTIP
jgi:hypothetical protein